LHRQYQSLFNLTQKIKTCRYYDYFLKIIPQIILTCHQLWQFYDPTFLWNRFYYFTMNNIFSHNILVFTHCHLFLLIITDSYQTLIDHMNSNIETDFIYLWNSSIVTLIFDIKFYFLVLCSYPKKILLYSTYQSSNKFLNFFF